MNKVIDSLTLLACITLSLIQVAVAAPETSKTKFTSSTAQSGYGIALAKSQSVVWDKPSTALYDTVPIGNGGVGLTVSATADGVLHITPKHHHPRHRKKRKNHLTRRHPKKP